MSSSNSVGGPSRGGDPVRDGQHPLDKTGEVAGRDRHAVDDDPFAVGDEMRLGRLANVVPRSPERGSGERDHAPLAVGARDEGAAHHLVRVAELTEQRPHPAQPEPDTEAPARFDGGQRLRVRAHSFVSSSS